MWKICPYCEADIAPRTAAARQTSSSRRRRRSSETTIEPAPEPSIEPTG
jgi:hypothetical protein